MTDEELREKLQAELDGFVLYVDDTPYGNEPTELSVFLRQCGYEDAMQRLGDEIMQLITQGREQRDNWWITTGLKQGGKKLHGPFATRDMALTMRTYVEMAEAPATYWVEQAS